MKKLKIAWIFIIISSLILFFCIKSYLQPILLLMVGMQILLRWYWWVSFTHVQYFLKEADLNAYQYYCENFEKNWIAYLYFKKDDLNYITKDDAITVNIKLEITDYLNYRLFTIISGLIVGLILILLAWVFKY